MKRLSVIVPGYNTRKEWWVRCVASLDRALTCDDEIIVVDDGSVEPVQRDWFESKIVMVIRHDKNKGLPTARNTGLDAAKGAFVTFVDSDDEVLPEAYSRSLDALERTKSDLAVFGMNVRFTKERFQTFDMPPDKYYGALRPEDVKELYRKRLFYYSCNKVFRMEFLSKNMMRFDPDGVPCEDAIFNVGLVMKKAKWVTVPYIGYVYYRYDGTICSNYKPTYVEGTRACTRIWREYKSTIPNAYEIFGTYDETSDDGIIRGQWLNIWRAGSGFGLRDKWQYAIAHRKSLGSFPLLEVLKASIVMFTRNHLYITPIRRWYQMRGMIRIGAKVEKL